MSTLYDELDVASDASPEDITRAYRKKAQQWHPDRHPDNQDEATEKFKRIQHAYEILSDAEKRARYDETGEDGEEPSMQRKAQAFLLKLVDEIIQRGDAEFVDIIRELATAISDGMDQAKKRIKSAERDAKRLERIAGRFKRKGGGENLFSRIAQQRAAAARHAVERIGSDIELAKEMLNMLDDYSFDPAKLKPGDATVQADIEHSFAQIFRAFRL